MGILNTVYNLVRKTEEPIALDDLPCGADSIETHMIKAIYSNALDKGLFDSEDEDRLKTLFRNMRTRYGGDVVSEDRIEATIDVIKKACGEFSLELKQTDHARTKAIVAKTPEIWR